MTSKPTRPLPWFVLLPLAALLWLALAVALYWLYRAAF